jgi:phosphopantetheinyl transferase
LQERGSGTIGVAVTEDCQAITVHTVSFDHGGGPVFHASLPGAGESVDGHRTDAPGARHRLVSLLWDHLVALKSPLWSCFHCSPEAALPIHLVRGPLGRPHLLLGADRGPAISFSDGGGSVWAALCGDRSDIGIDVAGADEFHQGYPFHRVFTDQELQHALSLAGGELGNASALLWSVKEAVVKALGCGLHLVDPRQVNVYPAVAGGEDGYTVPVRLSGKALVRFPASAGRTVWVRALPQAKLWLSVTLLSWQP